MRSPPPTPAPGHDGGQATCCCTPHARRFLKEVREGVSDRGRGVRSRGERAPAWGTRKPWEIDTFNEGLEADGHWVFAGGLAAPGSATVIDNRGGEAMVPDGPFLESKEYLAGFWIIEAAGLDVALKLAAQGSKACNRKVEVRLFL
jgi:hypothetical protein